MSQLAAANECIKGRLVGPHITHAYRHQMETAAAGQITIKPAKAPQNTAAVLLAASQKGHRYSFPHSKISTAPPVMNGVFGQAVDAQLQANELEYATKYYAAILARATGKDLATCQKEYLNRKRYYFSVKEAYEEGLVDKLIPGYKLNRFRKIAKDTFGEREALYGSDKPKLRFERRADQA
ncbi:MAG: hypothetical protein J3K34DRAFT_278736 [Monoraphidium minutum]|nr:MAG: hypothetical protein J3K34DRAFT_278736 [Monoraphidium minutum]